MKIKERRKIASKLFKEPVSAFEKIDLSTVSFIPPGMTRAFRNNRYTVMIYDNSLSPMDTWITKALIQRHDDRPIEGHWKELQKIKNEIFGTEVWGVEFYPAESQLIDQKNIYWLWILEFEQKLF